MLGLSLDRDMQEMNNYIEKIGINYPVLTGEDDIVDLGIKLGNDAGIVPFTVIIDREGIIREIKYGLADRQSLEKAITAAL